VYVRYKKLTKSKPARRSLRNTWVALGLSLFVLSASAGWLVVHNYNRENASLAAHALTSSVVQTNPDPQFGMAVGNVLMSMSTLQLDTELQSMYLLGVRWIRYDINWGDVQPTNATTYNWTNYDRVVQIANGIGLKSLVTIGYTPLWARQANCRTVGDTCPPADPTMFAHFAAVTAARYAPQGVHDWEIWNEPNVTTFWKPAPDPGAYTTLLKATATAIRAHDSQATIMVGGLTGSLTTTSSISAAAFLQDIYIDGGRSSFDAVAMHPYTYPYTPSNSRVYSWQEMAGAPINLRNIMQTYGDTSKKIWITEYGAPTDGPGTMLTVNSNVPIGANNYVSEALQAQLLTSAVQQYETYPWVGPFFWYSYQDLSTNTNTRENFFGLLRANGTQKPAYAAYKAAITNALSQ